MKVEAVIVPEFIASLNVAVTIVLIAAVVLVLSGVTAVTCGGGGAAVVNAQTSLEASEAPRVLVIPVVRVAV